MKLIIISAVILTGFISMASVYMIQNKTEKVNYVVLRKYESFEVRSYPELIVASTVCGTGKYESNSSKGFRKIAGYIFGGNEGQNQIAMTSPVKMTLDDTMKMSFYMPNDYSMDELPQPKDKSVKIGKAQKQVVAAIQFGGWANQEEIDFYKTKLIKALKKNNIEFNNDFAFLGYNAPYEMMNRRNEIIVTLKKFK
jgi:hypothetical protein